MPKRFGELMNAGTPAQCGRVMNAMMQMTKFDVSQLEAAFNDEQANNATASNATASNATASNATASSATNGAAQSSKTSPKRKERDE